MVNMFTIESEKDRIIAGFASVEIKDLQGDIVPIEELEKAMYKLMDRGGYIFYGHQNKPVGKILRWEIREHPEAKTKGLWIVAKIFDDYEIDNAIWSFVKQNRLTGFSIGGVGKAKTVMWKENGESKPVNILHDIQLMEISLVEKPANQYAKIDFVNNFAKGVKEVECFERGECGWFVVYKDGSREQISDEVFMGMMSERDKLIGIVKEFLRVYEPTMWDDVAYALYDMSFSELSPEKKSIVKTVTGKLYDTMAAMHATLILEGHMNGFERGEVELLTKELKSYIDEGIVKSEGIKILEKIKKDEKLSEHEKETLSRVIRLAKMFRTAIKKKDLAKAIIDAYIEIQKPFAGFDNFDDCLKKMKEQGYDEDSAKRICGKLQSEHEKGITEYMKGANLDDVMKEYIKANGLCSVVKEMITELDKYKDVIKAEDLRPPKEWWDRCMERTGGRAALCGWVFYHHLKPTKPEGKKDEPYTRSARRRKRSWLEENKELEKQSLILIDAFYKNMIARTKNLGK